MYKSYWSKAKVSTPNIFIQYFTGATSQCNNARKKIDTHTHTHTHTEYISERGHEAVIIFK